LTGIEKKESEKINFRHLNDFFCRRKKTKSVLFFSPADFGMDTLTDLVEKTNFPWLMSNVIDNETGRPLADGKVTHIMEWWGRKIGLVCNSNSFLLSSLVNSPLAFFIARRVPADSLHM
jgi:hypothetical protein